MFPMKTRKLMNAFHVGFELALLMKALNAAVEVLGGVLLCFVTPGAANQFISRLTAVGLRRDPDNFLAGVLIRLGGSFTLDVQRFGIFYLLSHGLVKLVIVWLLWRKKLWAYPLSAMVLCFFIVYQTYQFAITPSLLLVLLTLLDAIVIVLTLVEYARQRRQRDQAGETHDGAPS